MRKIAMAGLAIIGSAWAKNLAAGKGKVFVCRRSLISKIVSEVKGRF
jgi:hypothetical protein